ncbi:hypothetical protein SAMN05444166_6035 [Singulisphaera sp. GP187]|uniref:DNA gyrase inhibitor YacG n=1 Tax=Singulisphaera sp. GP187 TaxID=1882752 RepID=UPI00092B4F79|nr:DNA gyrase inhibitor YacG [Singulisphaera sp. GP187]SIO59392.1 hypothetical protein SAMN05444166_6035 [Singulisphaera sp. GP187]
MIRGRCPTCAKKFEIESIDKLPSFPFCSDRCRLVDLGRWIDGTYAVPDDVTTPTPAPNPSEDEADD